MWSFMTAIFDTLSTMLSVSYEPIVVILVLPLIVKHVINVLADINTKAYCRKLDDAKGGTTQHEQVVGDLYATVLMTILVTFFIMRILKSKQHELGIDLSMIQTIISSLMIGLGFSLRDFVSNFVAGMSLGNISLIEKNTRLYVNSIVDHGNNLMQALKVIDRQTSGVIVSQTINVSVTDEQGMMKQQQQNVYRFIPNSILCERGFSVNDNSKTPL